MLSSQLKICKKQLHCNKVRSFYDLVFTGAVLCKSLKYKDNEHMPAHC